MQDYETAREQLLQSFLTELSVNSPPVFVEEIARKFLSRTYSLEWVDDFWEGVGENFISDLVEEYNRRVEDGFPVYFTFIDDAGRKIRGWENPSAKLNTTVFQQALLRLTDTEFEKLCGRILYFAGCIDAWSTPPSHDQGLDAFGCFSLFKFPKFSDDVEKLTAWILVQAKHYVKEKVCSKDIRELVGSRYLATYEIYSTESKKYEQLKLKPLAPVALILATSGEIKRTSRLLAARSGVELITASDLCVIFHSYWADSGVTIPDSPDEIAQLLREEAALVSITK